jgi:hypothetical protein
MLGPPLSPASAVYSAGNDTVTLIPRGKLNLRKREKLAVNASLVTDTLGRPIDGGTNYVAVISKSRVTVGAVAAVRRQCELVAAAVDALLEREDLHHRRYGDRWQSKNH